MPLMNSHQHPISDNDEITIVGLNSEMNIHAYFNPSNDKILVRVARVPKRKYLNAGMKYEECGGKSGVVVSVSPSALPPISEGEAYPEVDITAQLLLEE